MIICEIVVALIEQIGDVETGCCCLFEPGPRPPGAFFPSRFRKLAAKSKVWFQEKLKKKFVPFVACSTRVLHGSLATEPVDKASEVVPVSKHVHQLDGPLRLLLLRPEQTGHVSIYYDGGETPPSLII